MNFRIRRQVNGLYILESEETTTEPPATQYWKGHGTFVTQQAAADFAVVVKESATAVAVHAADVAAGRDIVSTFVL